MYPNYFPQPQQQIIRVNGQNGAMAYQMMPNSSALLLDETAPLVWLAVTDGGGYKTITPYKIEKYVPAPPADYKALLERIERLEGKLNESNTTESTKQIPEQQPVTDWQQYATTVTSS